MKNFFLTLDPIIQKKLEKNIENNIRITMAELSGSFGEGS